MNPKIPPLDNKNINMKSTIKFINKTYDELSFFDLYGNSVIILIFMTLFVFLVFSYCQIMQTKQSIADDWNNQRCKPQNLPFAGFITSPEGKTSFQYTNENFQYCVQRILRTVSGTALEPFQFMIQSLIKIFSELSGSIQQTRVIINRLRNNIKQFTEDILSKILNVMIPIQKMFIALMDTFQKIQGVFTSGLYTMLGTYYTLQALIGSILEIIINILSALAIIVIGLWILPFTWPAAASMSAVFLAISIPLSIIIYFMTEVLHIKASGIPKLRCFDRKSKFYLNDGTFSTIEDLKSGDVLYDGSYITSKIKISSQGLDMFVLDNVIVSESHIVKYNNKWIPVKNHPLSRKLYVYDEPYLYCLNTSNKIIRINNTTFTDWDEIYDDTLDYILNKLNTTPENIHKIMDVGLNANTMIQLYGGNNEQAISNINIGTKLSTGGIVYGIVELINKDLENEKVFDLLVSNGKIGIDNNIYNDYNYNIDSIIELYKNII